MFEKFTLRIIYSLSLCCVLSPSLPQITGLELLPASWGDLKNVIFDSVDGTFFFITSDLNMFSLQER